MKMKFTLLWLDKQTLLVEKCKTEGFSLFFNSNSSCLQSFMLKILKNSIKIYILV